jgi:diaminopimelate decarboxylase
MAPVDHLICYAVKSNPTVRPADAGEFGQRIRHRERGELHRVIQAGGAIRGNAFSPGRAKPRRKLNLPLRQKVYCLNAESEPELERINRIAARRKTIARRWPCA